MNKKSNVKINLKLNNLNIVFKFINLFKKKYVYPLIIDRNYGVKTMPIYLKIIKTRINFREQKKAVNYDENNSIDIKKFKRKFVYFSAISNPERTSNPDGQNFCNNIFAVQMLDCILDNDICIIYKEHPRSFNKLNRHSNHMNLDYLKELHKIGRLFFVNINTDVNFLIDKSVFVAAINGSIGIKSIVRGKEFLHFGTSFYENFTGVNDIFNYIKFKKLKKPSPSELEILYKNISMLPLLRYYWVHNRNLRHKIKKNDVDFNELNIIINNFLSNSIYYH